MRITDLLDVRSISLNAAPADKSQTLDAAVSLMTRSGKINDEEAYRKQVYAREEESTTGIGEGIAIPHGKCDAVEKPGLAAMVIPGGVDFDSLDGEPVTLLFLIAAPNTEDNVHLDVLSKLSMMLMDEDFTKSLRAAKTPEEFLAIIDQADEEKKSVDERLADMGEAEADQFKILAVTSCPTGIAHTYMAAEGIEKAAKAKNCFVKIETRGSGGAKNVLTEQEIQDADCIIVAADAQVPMDRFDGKKVIQRQVSDGINKADELVELAMSGNVPVYHSGNASASSQSQNKAGGSVHIESIDMMGNKSILNRIAPGQVFGETYACIPGEKLLIGVTAAEDCQILFLEVGKIFHTCPDTCPCHEKLIRNMLMVMAKKNLELSRRSLHTAPKSIRGRLLSYFSQEMVQQGSSQFMIPFNRQELADYLGVDRSALSNELGKMRKEGIIEVNRNQIHYLERV